MSDVYDDYEVGSITHFYRELRGGDRAAAEELWNRFFPRLMGLARKTLAGRPQRMADAEDAVISAFASFFQQAEDGGLSANMRRSNLWKLLGVMTVRKARKQAVRERTQKRGAGQVAGALKPVSTQDKLLSASCKSRPELSLPVRRCCRREVQSRPTPSRKALAGNRPSPHRHAGAPSRT